MQLLDYNLQPLIFLTTAFAAWKAFLLTIALGTSFAHDYDTSTSLFFQHAYGASANFTGLATRLTRWDALYFMHSTRVGYVYEQEWAFAMGLPMVVRAVGGLLRGLGLEMSGVWEPLVAIAVAHVSHLMAVLALYKLTMVISNDRKLALVASAVHILSPAGLFLSAPYAESPFSCLSFVGNLLFALGLQAGPDSLKRNGALVGAGIVFGLSISFRSNGLFGGILFAVEVAKDLVALKNAPSLPKLLRLMAPILGGLFVAVGAVIPQFFAWRQYCGDQIDGELRPWCSKLIPSIYTFVQEEYW